MISYQNGKKNYILHSEFLKIGDEICSGEDAPIKIGNALQLGKLYIGKDQVLYSSGFKNSNSYPYQRDIAAVSFDKGRTWQLDEEGNMIQASTFDEKSNKVFMLKGGKVSSRELTKLSSLLN